MQNDISCLGLSTEIFLVKNSAFYLTCCQKHESDLKIK